MEKKLLGLINSIKKESRLPELYNAALKSLYLNHEYEYQVFPVKPERFDAFFSKLDSKGIYGFNISIEHQDKISAMVQLDEAADYLNNLKLVDTVVKKYGKWKGHNVSVDAFIDDLKDHFDPHDKRCIVIGAGYWGKVVTCALAQEGAKQICIYDKDEKQLDALVSLIRVVFSDIEILPIASFEDIDMGGKELIVNTTSLGKKLTDPLPIKEKYINNTMFIYDIIWEPGETRLLHSAKLGGLATSNGLGMFLRQIVFSLEIFVGKTASVDILRIVLSGESEKKKKTVLMVLCGIVFWLIVYIIFYFSLRL